MKKLLFILILLIGFVGFSQENKVAVQLEVIEVNGYVQYSRDNGTIIIDRENTTLYELKTPIRFQEGNVYTYFLKPKVCLDCTTIEAELIGHTVSIEQTEKNVAALRNKIMTKNN